MVKSNRRAGKRELDKLIFDLLSEEEPLTRSEIRNKTGKLGTQKTLTNALDRLTDGPVKKINEGIEKGKYALVDYIPLEEARGRIREALEELSEDYDVARLEDISEISMIPKSWKWKKGNIELTFDSIAYVEARNIGLRLGKERKEKEKVGGF